jgi:DNA-binding LytR/AlgR family response regulator
MYLSSLHIDKSSGNGTVTLADSDSDKVLPLSINRSLKIASSGAKLIRVLDKKESYLWVEPNAIVFVKSADHYVKTLIQEKQQKKWALRHSTIKDLLPLLSGGEFLRLNRFYIINCLHFSHFDRNKKTIYFKDGFSIFISHTISRFILEAFL